jgi:hypothetical protein
MKQDLWNLKSYLELGQDRASWCYFVDSILADFLEMSYLNFHPEQIVNIFLQDVHVPLSSQTKDRNSVFNF